MNVEFGLLPPSLVASVPGPKSLALADDLRRFESPNVTYLSPSFPVFWAEARGANVRDVDGNLFVDMTAAFAVAAAGHSNPTIAAAVSGQASRLMHGMGDVHPPAIKVELLRQLAEAAPGELSQSILANSGAEAVEAALKTMALATGKPRVLAFHGGYHGLTLGALSVSGRGDFRAPFARQVADTAIFAPYPYSYRSVLGEDPDARAHLAFVERILDGPMGEEVGGILVEPVQGRGGDVVPPGQWLPGLRRICDERGLLLIVDEVYTGFGRTGRLFACEHSGVVPDLMVMGKALTGGLPFAACIGTPRVMSAWPPSTGEALHTSTFLGNPLGCAAALASLHVIAEEKLVQRAADAGDYLRIELERLIGGHSRVGEIRGLGLMVGIELVRNRVSRLPDRELAGHVVVESLRRGFILLGGGVHSNVLSLSPPLSITLPQMDAFLEMMGGLFTEII